MTIATTDTRFASNGDGTTVSFTYPRPYIDPDDIKVLLVVTATGVEEVQTRNTHYTVTGSGLSNGVYASATIAFTTPPPSTKKVVRYLDQDMTNETDVEALNSDAPDVISRKFDEIALKLQRLDDRIDRTLRQPEGDVTSLAAIEPLVTRAGKFAAFNSSGALISSTTQVSTTTAATDAGVAIATTASLPYPAWTGWAGILASNSAATNASAAASFETSYPGWALGGGKQTYAITARPTGARYYDIRWNVSGTVYDEGPYRDHPLDGPQRVVKWEGKHQISPGGIGWVASGDYIVVSYGRTLTHNPRTGAMTHVAISKDGLASLRDTRTVYSSASWELVGLMGGMMDANRFALLGVETNTAGSANDVKVIYSDDWDDLTVEPTTVTLANATYYMFPHGEWIPGESTGEFWCLGHTTGSIRYIKTTNKCTAGSFSAGVVKAGTVAFPNPVEPVGRRHAANKYFVIYRDDDGGNIRGSAGTALTSQGAFVDMGIPSSAQPMFGISWGGIFTLYISARDGDPINGYEDKMLAYDFNEAALYASLLAGTQPTIPSPRVVSAGGASFIGYGHWCEYRTTRHLAIIEATESQNGSANSASSQLMSLGGDAIPAASPAVIRERGLSTPRVLTDNPFWLHDDRQGGSASGSITSSTKIVDRWRGARTSVGATFQRAQLAHKYSEIYPWSPTLGLRIVGAGGGSGVIIEQRFYGEREIMRHAGRPQHMIAGIHGTVPSTSNYFRSRSYIYDGSTTFAESIADCAQRNVAGDATIVEVSSYNPSVLGATIGAGAYFGYQFIINGSGAIDAYLAGLWWGRGDQAVMIDIWDPNEEAGIIQKQVQSYFVADNTPLCQVHASSTTDFSAVLQYPIRMAGTPVAITEFSSAASEWDINSPRAGGTGPVAIADCATLRADESEATAYGCGLTGTVAAGLTDQEPYWLMAKGGTRRFIIDAEPV